MKALKGVLHLAVAMALTAGLVGCGAPSTGSYASYSMSASGISEQEALQIKSFNDGGLLDLLPLEELDDEDFGVTSLDDSSDANAIVDAAAVAGKSTTKIGYVRSVEDGKFFLQVQKGIFKKKDLSFPLVASSEQLGMKLAKLLNKRVIIRGKTADQDTVTLTRAFQLPSFSLLSDLLNTGKIKGKIYDARTMQTLDEANVTARSLNTGRLYRATSRRDGSFSFSRLTPGDYSLDVSLPGYAPNGVAKITVQKRKVSPTNIGLGSGM